MHQRIMAALVAALVAAGLLAAASPASAAVPPHCGSPWPTDGQTVVSVAGNEVVLELSYMLHGPSTPGTQLYAAKCASPYVKVLYVVDNAGAVNNGYTYSTTLPYGSSPAPKYVGPASGQLVAGAAIVNTFSLTSVRYTMTVRWTKTTAGPASFRLQYYAFRLRTGIGASSCAGNPTNAFCQLLVDSHQLHVTHPVVPGTYALGA